MTIDSQELIDAVASHAAASGFFEIVNTHEPKNSPGNGLSAAVWCQKIGPNKARSGLDVTSAYIVFTMRIFSSMTQEPQDAIDPNIMAAVDYMIGAYTSDFSLDSFQDDNLEVDLLNAYGSALEASAGYVNVGGSLQRVMDITIPMTINDAWNQVR